MERLVETKLRGHPVDRRLIGVFSHHSLYGIARNDPEHDKDEERHADQYDDRFPKPV